MINNTIVIIGAGHAGIRAAVNLRKLGFDGRLVMIAEEGAQLPYERPPLSKWTSDQEKPTNHTKPIFSAETLTEANIETIEEKVVGIDKEAKTVQLAHGKSINYSKLLLATGAGAREFTMPGLDRDHVFHLRDLVDADGLYEAASGAKSAIVIGGGFIGLELAASLTLRGIEVHVIEMANRLLARAVGAKVAKIVQILHEDNGVQFHFGSPLAKYEFIDECHQITLVDDTRLKADLLVAGIGSVPNTTLAEKAGLEVENGIVVDSQLKTSDPDIYAAGDCCAFPLYGDANNSIRLESWQAAGQQGDIAAFNMLNLDNEPKSCDGLMPWFWSEQYDHVLQVVGISSLEDEITERSYAESHHITFATDDEHILKSACGIAPQTKIAKDIRIAMKIAEANLKLNVAALTDPNITLKGLLKK